MLEKAGLVYATAIGRVRHCRLAVQPLQQASEWLAQYRSFWEKQLESLARYLRQQKTVEVAEWHELDPNPKPRCK